MLQSHTWGTEEVLFHEFQEQRAAEMRGYGKITGCCRQAASDGLDYLVCSNMATRSLFRTLTSSWIVDRHLLYRQAELFGAIGSHQFYV